jgi:putative endonuclease
MPLFSRLMFGAVRWAARKGLRGDAPASEAPSKHQARQTGVRGETYAYWLLRSQGYIFIARNYTVPGMKGEIDLVGYDGPALAFVEVKTRTADDRTMGLPEDSVNSEKRRRLVRMARQFLAERRIEEAPCRFDVLAIESRPGRVPMVRLHKDAFTAT